MDLMVELKKHLEKNEALKKRKKKVNEVNDLSSVQREVGEKKKKGGRTSIAMFSPSKTHHR